MFMSIFQFFGTQPTPKLDSLIFPPYFFWFTLSFLISFFFFVCVSHFFISSLTPFEFVILFLYSLYYWLILYSLYYWLYYWLFSSFIHFSLFLTSYLFFIPFVAIYSAAFFFYYIYLFCLPISIFFILVALQDCQALLYFTQNKIT